MERAEYFGTRQPDDKTDSVRLIGEEFDCMQNMIQRQITWNSMTICTDCTAIRVEPWSSSRGLLVKGPHQENRRTALTAGGLGPGEQLHMQGVLSHAQKYQDRIAHS